MANVFTADELRNLAAKASSIDERLAGGFVAEETEDSAARASRHLQAWCTSATAGDDVLFRQRMLRDGIDVDAVRPLLGDVHFAEHVETPDWVATFRWALDAMVSPDVGRPAGNVLDPEKPPALRRSLCSPDPKGKGAARPEPW